MQRCITNLAKHLRWSVCKKFVTNFSPNSTSYSVYTSWLSHVKKINLQKSLHNRTDLRDLQEICLFPLKIVTRRFMRKLPHFTLCKLLRKLFNIWRITDQDNPRKLARCFRWNLVIVKYGLQFNGEFFPKSFLNGRRAQILW